VAVFAASVVVLRPYLGWKLSSRPQLGQRHFLPTQTLEAVHPIVERILLASYSGFTQLGNYAHSLAYRALFLQGVNAVNRATWPVTLEEARARGRYFVTGRVWAATHLGIAMVAPPFVLFGDTLIAALTNDKLTGASVFLAPWFVLILLQSSGKAATGVVYAVGESYVVARLGLLANAVALAALVALVPILGAPGAAAALLLQALVFRIALQVVVRRRTPIPFQDWGVLAGCVLVTALFFLRRHGFGSTESRLLLLVAAETACLAAGARIIRTTIVPLVLRARPGSA
jgi:O-antigen/teichoic acid export membrane protein